MYSPKQGYGTLSEEDAEPTLPSDILYRRAHRYGLWLLESISNNYRIEEAVSEYRHALEGFRLAVLAEVASAQSSK